MLSNLVVIIIFFFVADGIQQDLREECLLDMNEVDVQIPERAENASESRQSHCIVDEGRADLKIKLFDW